MIWHIFKKDLKLLWPMAAIVSLTFILHATLWFSLGIFTEPRSLRNIAEMFIIAPIVGVMALIVVAVHQDVLPGDRQDWLIRPIRRRDLVLAKFLFVLTAIHAPLLVVDIIHVLAAGFSFPDAFSSALSRNIDLLLVFSLPAMAIAAMTSTVVEAIGGLMGIAIALILFIMVTQIATPSQGMNTIAAMSGHFVMFQLWSAIALATALVVIPLQYFRRTTMRARGIALAALFVLVPLAGSIPWSSAFAFEQWLSPDPGAAQPIMAAFDPSGGKLVLKPDTPNPASSVWVPLRVSGLKPDSILTKDRVIVRIIGRDGALLYSGFALDDPQTSGIAGGGAIDDLPVRASDVHTHQPILLPGKIYDAVRGQPIRLELDYAFTLFRLETSDTIPALGGDKPVANLGRCKTRMDDDGDEVELACRVSRNDLSFCSTFVLENPVNGLANPLITECTNFWFPYRAHFAHDPFLKPRMELAFRDRRGLMKYPVDASQLVQARVAVKRYEPVAHFTRHLVIPEIRLGDWEAEPAH